MTRFSPAMAIAVAAMAIGLPATAFAQNVQQQQHGQPMSDEAMHNNTGHDDHMPPMQNGQMQNNPMHNNPMHDDQMHGDHMNGDMHDDMHSGMHGMGGHHGWHRHCWSQWRHHHRVRVCH